MRSPVAATVWVAAHSAYLMHGVNVAIESDEPILLRRLQRRLATFSSPATDATQADLRFQFRLTDDSRGIEGAPVPQRTVYHMGDVEFRYDQSSDLLFVRRGNRLVGVCNPNVGDAHFEVRVDTAADLDLYSETFFTVCLVELMKRHRLFSLHAAGISVGDAGILFAGPSGAGKSTLAIILLESIGSRAGFLGDDMLFLSAGAGEIRVLGWPEPIDVGEWTQRRLPALLPRMQVRATMRRKGQIAASDVAGAIPALEARPELIIFPRVTKQAKSTLAPISLDEALLELTPNVLLTEATSSKAHLAALGALARQCRCYRLDTGADAERLPGLLLGLI